MRILTGLLATLVFMFAAISSASAQWTYAVETDTAGLEYAHVSVAVPHASIYTECTDKLDMGLALILGANDDLIAQSGGAGGQILYMNDAGDSALATVNYAPGEGSLTLATPDREEIEAAWGVFANATEAVNVRFTFPPATQVYEVSFTTDGLADALSQLDAYCR